MTLRRRRRPRWTILITIILLMPLSVSAAQTAGNELVTTYMVALGDNRQSGDKIGCDDSIIPVTIEVPEQTTTEGRITAGLTKLFSFHDPYYGQSGLYNALYQNTLTVSSVEIFGNTAGIMLIGGTGSRGGCDEPRIEEQIARTALQFLGVSRVVIILNGGPLADYRGPIFFPQTGYEISQPFSSYWEQNGGIPVFGYPISDQRFEGGHRVQYFERQRFEHHPDNVEPYTIQLGLLGVEIAGRQGLLGTAPFQRQQPNGNPNCEYVPETGHHLCFGFRQYWHTHGLNFGDPGYSYRESLALFGYPISDEFTANGRTVQYFERARFEWHPENQPPWDILLGRLGADVYQGP